MDLDIEIAWYRIWNVVARGGDISEELDHLVALRRRRGDTMEPQQIREQVVEWINTAIDLGRVDEHVQSKRKLIDAEVRKALGIS